MTPPHLGKEKNKTILFALGISLFGALFLWNFWGYGINVLGLNSVVYGCLFIAFFVYMKRESLTKKSLLWLIPLSLIVLSFGIYANSFTKGISLFLLPLMFFIFSTHEAHKEVRSTLWSKAIFVEAVFAIFGYINSVFEAFRLFSFKKSNSTPTELPNSKKNLWLQILLGIGLLLALSTIIVIPLLSSADSQFSDIFSGIMTAVADFFAAFFREDFFSRALCTAIGMLLLLGYGIYWNTKITKREMADDNDQWTHKYDITISIVLSGVLALYLIFIGLQLKTLFLGTLPVDFEQTVYMVKTGFWQLFMLTILNILFYIGLFQKSTKTVQRILSFFTFASLLLIVSAAYRTYLYVATYGLSYEKFYAFYTVLFCIGVFVWFIYLDIRKKQGPEIVRNLAFASLWMYALTTVVPLERLIFSTNLALTQQSDSRVNINELYMLGFDALPAIEKNFDLLVSEGQKDHKQQIERSIDEANGNFPEEAKNAWLAQDIKADWLNWVKQTKESAINLPNYHVGYEYQMDSVKPLPKRWYEKTISELIY